MSRSVRARVCVCARTRIPGYVQLPSAADERDGEAEAEVPDEADGKASLARVVERHGLHAGENEGE